MRPRAGSCVYAMDIRLSPGDLAFREEVREFLRAQYPDDIRQGGRGHPARAG